MSLSSDYFQKLVESSPDIIIAVNRSGTIIFYNDGARQNLGFTQEEMLGKDVLEIYPSRDEAQKVMAAMRRGEAERGKVCNFETVFKTKQGEPIPVAISASIIYDAAGGELGSIGFAKDLRGIRRRDQLATLCEIAIGLSHEINNSLEILVNQLDLLQEYVGRVATDEEYVVESERLESVEQQVKKIQAITRRIGEMAEGGEYGTKEYHDGRMMADLKMAGAKPEEEDQKDASLSLEGLRLLVVDDDLGVCCSLKELLQKERCIVETAPSGVKAMELMEGREFDMVLSDVVMPDMDGYALYRAVKKERPALPVVLMTAFYYDKDHVIKRSCLDGLKCVIFKKPIDPDRLKKIILEQCRKDEIPKTCD